MDRIKLMKERKGERMKTKRKKNKEIRELMKERENK